APVPASVGHQSSLAMSKWVARRPRGAGGHRSQGDPEHGGVDAEGRREFGADTGWPRQLGLPQPRTIANACRSTQSPARVRADPLELEGELVALHLYNHASGAGG